MSDDNYCNNYCNVHSCCLTLKSFRAEIIIQIIKKKTFSNYVYVKLQFAGTIAAIVKATHKLFRVN